MTKLHKQPSLSDKDILLLRQENACYWCRGEFGHKYVKRSRIGVIRVTWDHIIPKAHCRRNSKVNLVLSCQECNWLKNDLYFDTDELCRNYLIKKRRQKQIFNV